MPRTAWGLVAAPLRVADRPPGPELSASRDVVHGPILGQDRLQLGEQGRGEIPQGFAVGVDRPGTEDFHRQSGAPGRPPVTTPTRDREPPDPSFDLPFAENVVPKT